ncbi:MAG: FAD-dependent monooxygenase, partial [Burkholderiales bacterium]
APPHRPHYQMGGARDDRRTAALFGGSVELLRNLEVWNNLRDVSEPLTAIRIIDDTGGLMKAPEVLFKAGDAGLDAFGYNVPNAALVTALFEAARHPDSGIEVLETAGIVSLDCQAPRVRATTHEGLMIEADLVAAADGRNSICRQAAGITTRVWDYPQSAVVCSFEHSRPHRTVSTEFHRQSGPFTVVPMPGNASSLVWVETPQEAARLAGLVDIAMIANIEDRLQGLLGSVKEISQRAAFPLSGLTASTFAANRVALAGEAGHVIPPIGAQGLNLGLRDAATLADCVDAASRRSEDIGGSAVMSDYASARRADVTSRIWTMDLLNRSLITDFLPVQLARGAGLYALQALEPLRRYLLREGIQPSGSTPNLMKPGGGATYRAGRHYG